MPKLLPKLVNKFRLLTPRTHKIIAGAILILILILIFPFQTTIVPRWDLRVVDDDGNNVAGSKVTEHWQHNSLEAEGHEELKLTDAEGRVVFPARKIRASLTTRALAPLTKFLREGNRAKFGPYASVVVWGGNHHTNVAIYEDGQTPPSTVVVEKLIIIF
jgi:hypothetical protein